MKGVDEALAMSSVSKRREYREAALGVLGAGGDRKGLTKEAHFPGEPLFGRSITQGDVRYISNMFTLICDRIHSGRRARWAGVVSGVLP